MIECALIPRSASGAGGDGNPRPLHGPSRQGDGNPMHAQPVPSLHSHLTLLPGGAPLDAGGVALMKDQVRALAERSVKAVYVGDAKKDAEVAKICAGSYPLVFLSPEALLTDAIWRDMLQGAVYKERLVGVAIDEAHCVKKW